MTQVPPPRRSGRSGLLPRLLTVLLLAAASLALVGQTPAAAAVEPQDVQAQPNKVVRLYMCDGGLLVYFHFGPLSNYGHAVRLGSVEIVNFTGMPANIDGTVSNMGRLGSRSFAPVTIGNQQRWTWNVNTDFWPLFSWESHTLGACALTTDQVIFHAPTRSACQGAASSYNWSQSVCLYVNSDPHRPAIFVRSQVTTGGAFNRSGVKNAILYVRLWDASDGTSALYQRDITTDLRTSGGTPNYEHRFASGTSGHWYYAEAWARVATYAGGDYNTGHSVGEHPVTDQLLR